MKMKKNINSILLTVLAFTTCVTFSETFSKLTSKFSNLAWVTKFTELILGEDVFVIEDPNDFSGNQLGVDGAIRIPTSTEYKNMSEEEYDALVEKLKKYDSTASFSENKPSYSDFQNEVNAMYAGEDNLSGGITVTGSNSYDGYYYMPQSEFDDLMSESKSPEDFAKYHPYSLGNVGTRGFTLSNYTNTPMLMEFDLYYYAPELNSSSNSLSCGVNNVTNNGENITSSDAQMLKCEFVNQVDTVFHFYKEGIANAKSQRVGDGKQVVDPDGDLLLGFIPRKKYYYPYHSIISPYDIKQDWDLQSYYQSLGTATDGFGVDKSKVDLRFLVSDFIIPPDKKNYIYNLSMYCGSTFGAIDTSELDFAFITGIEIKITPISKGDEVDTYISTNETEKYNFIWGIQA